MTATFIISTILEVTAAVLVILGFAFEEKVIAFEDNCKDKIARRVARFIRTSKLTKNMIKVSPVVVQKRAETNYICASTTTTTTPGKRKSTGRVA